jgi:hydrogenase maturation protease
MTRPILVAGIGNLFLGDDGFGPEVVRRLADDVSLPDHVRVVDYRIRGLHLAYDLLEEHAALVIVDAVPRGEHPGDLTVMTIGSDDLGTAELDAHGMNPVAVLGALGSLGGTLPPTYVVGCRPESVEEGIGLSDSVAAAVPGAVAEVRALLDHLGSASAAASIGTRGR